MSALVSVIIPTYNYGAYIAEALDSVLGQTFTSVECIVIDDGSKDNTPEVVAGYGDRIQVIRQQNKGAVAARNAGIEAARGDLIAFLDADDRWEPTKLAKQVAGLDADSSLMAIGCGARLFGPGAPGNPEFVHEHPRDDCAENLRLLATRRLWIGGSLSGVLVRKRVFELEGKFDSSLRAAEDWDMWLRIAARHRFDNLPDVLTNIRSHQAGTFRNAALVEEYQWRVYQKAIEAWPDILDWKVRRRMRALILADAGGEYVLKGDSTSAFLRYGASLLEWPFTMRRWRATTSAMVHSILSASLNRPKAP